MNTIIPAGTDASANISELPSLLKRWMQIQEEINVLNGEIRGRRTQSKALKDVILRIMETNSVAKLNVSKGAVVHKTREVAEKISNDFMLKHFKDFFGGDEERAKALIEYLETRRSVITKHDLSLQVPRGDDDRSSRL